MAIHFTTISSNYVRDWNAGHGIREVMQNALDSHDKGFKMGAAYSRMTKTLTIYNRGAKLAKENLLMGSTSKAGDTAQRGNYGEGMKVGCLALLRAGKKVVIHNGKELWRPIIKTSEEYGADVLAFEIVRNRMGQDRLTFDIQGVTPEEWSTYKNLFINFIQPDSKTILTTPVGKILLMPELKGKIFCGGIYVDTHKDLHYGYDFNVSELTLNRDRNMANSFDVKWNTSRMWALISMSKRGKLFDTYDMLKKGIPDVEYFQNFSDYTVKGSVVDKFIQENPPRSYPVTSEEEATKVRSIGYNPVFSSGSYAGTVRSSMGDIDTLVRRVEAEYSLFHSMTPIDDANLEWTFEVMHKIDPKFKFKISLVQFEVNTTRSVSDKRDLALNHNLLNKKYDILQEAIRHYCLLEKKHEPDIWKILYRNTVEGMVE